MTNSDDDDDGDDDDDDDDECFEYNNEKISEKSIKCTTAVWSEHNTM